MNPNPLDQLRDIHLPSEGISFWPLAPGWWLVLIALLLTAFLALFFWLRTRRRRGIVSQSLKAVADLEKNASLSAQEWLAEVSSLLRRVVISLYGRDRVAGLVGSDWMTFLDAQGKTTDFTQGAAKVLADQPYAPSVDYDRKAVTASVNRWLKRQRRARKG